MEFEEFQERLVASVGMLALCYNAQGMSMMEAIEKASDNLLGTLLDHLKQRAEAKAVADEMIPNG